MRVFILTLNRSGRSRLGGTYTNKTRLWAALVDHCGQDQLDALSLEIRESNRSRVCTYTALCGALAQTEHNVTAVNSLDVVVFAVRECDVNQPIQQAREAEIQEN